MGESLTEEYDEVAEMWAKGRLLLISQLLLPLGHPHEDVVCCVGDLAQAYR